jgi:hypothetical protein
VSLIPTPKNCDDSVRIAIQKLASSKVGPTSSPTFAGLTLTGLTDNSIIYSASDVLTSLGAATNGQIPIGSTGAAPSLATITGTANQITSTAGAGSITLSTPQDIHTGASPTFANLSLGTGELTCGSINRAADTLTLEIGGTAEVSITSTTVTLGGNLIIPDGGTIGSVSDTNVMTIDASGNTTFTVFPITPSAAPDANYEVANKKYVDDTHAGAPAAHTIASHSDTSGTGAELNTLTDGSDAGALHSHAAAYQPLDTGLTNLAALTVVSDSFIKATATDTYEIRTVAQTADDLEGAIDHNQLANYDANKHVDHTGVTLTAGTGLTGGGDISSNRTFAVDGVLEDLDTLGANSADSEFLVGTAAGALTWESGATARTSLGLGTGNSPQFTGIELGHASDTTLTRVSAGVVAIEGTNIAMVGGAHHDGFSDFVANEHIDHSGVTLTAGKGLSGGGTIAANRTFTVDLTEMTGNVTWDDGSTDASITWTYALSGANDPVWTIGSNSMDLTTGALKQGGTQVLLVGDAATAHDLLDGSVHSDSVADAVTRGSLIYGNSTPKWDELVVGAADTFLGSDGTDVSYRTAAQVMASLSGAAAASFSFNSQALTNVGAITSTELTLSGHLAVGGVSIDPDYGIYHSETLVDTDNSFKAAFYSYLTVEKTAAAMTNVACGVYGAAGIGGSNTQNWTNTIGLVGVRGDVFTGWGSSGTITGVASFYTLGAFLDAATITNLYGLYVDTPIVLGNKVTNVYGVYLADQNTGATLNYAIYTNAGLVRFGDAITGISTAVFEGASVSIGKASTTTGTLVLYDSNSANTITLTIPDISAGSLTFTLPPTDGDNTNVLQTDGNGVLTWVAAAAGANHAILDGSVHTDSVADAVTRGSIIYGNSTPKWDELVIGTGFLRGDGTDCGWLSYANSLAAMSGQGAAAFDLNGQDLTNGGVLFLTEQAAAEANIAGKGQFWVKNTVPCRPSFDDDAGNEFSLDNRYVRRTGNPSAYDYTEATLTLNGVFHPDDTNNYIYCAGAVFVSNQYMYQDWVVACNSTPAISYRGTNTTWTICRFAVKGWWLAR